MFLYMLGPESDGYRAVFVGTDRNWLEASSGGLWRARRLARPYQVYRRPLVETEALLGLR